MLEEELDVMKKNASGPDVRLEAGENEYDKVAQRVFKLVVASIVDEGPCGFSLCRRVDTL